MEIGAVFLDVDGTLISFRTHEVPRSAVEALRAAHARGVRLFIATGRAASDLEQLSEIPYDGVVSLNGARCLTADGRVVSQRLIPREDFEQALRLADELDFPLALELDAGIFVNRVTADVERVARQVDHPVPEATDLRALFDRTECCQMCFYCDAGREPRIMAEFPGLTANRWNPLFADINVRGVDKASGMAAMAARCGFALAEVMAFGDGGNDISMLRHAGIGVAMGNANNDVKAASNYTTTSVDEDGIANALKYFGIVGNPS